MDHSSARFRLRRSVLHSVARVGDNLRRESATDGGLRGIGVYQQCARDPQDLHPVRLDAAQEGICSSFVASIPPARGRAPDRLPQDSLAVPKMRCQNNLSRGRRGRQQASSDRLIACPMEHITMEFFIQQLD